MLITMCTRPALFLITIFLTFLTMGDATAHLPTFKRPELGDGTPFYLEYETVSGFFLQDDNSTDGSTFDYV
jgi:hypothetical protein